MKNKLLNIAKKATAIGLSLIMSIGAVDTIAFAQAMETPSEIEEYVCVNPRYESDLSDNELETILEEELFTSQTTNVTYNANEEALPTITDAAIFVRDNMIARNEAFTVEFESRSLDFTSLIAEIFDLAVSEDLANSTVAGDYLAWQYGGYSCSGSIEVTDNDTYLYMVDLKVSYYTTAAEEKAVTEAITGVLNDMGIDELSPYTKIKAIYDYICDVCDYDYSNNNSFKKFSAYGAIKEQTAVCQGYSVLFYRMCKEAGIDTRVIAGNNHSWNIVKIDNIYYNADATWDDNYYDKNLPYQYFLTCNPHFPNHTRIAKYNTKDFNTKHTMTNECYYDIHPELLQRNSRMVNEQNNTPVESPKVCKTHKGKLTKTVAATCTKAGYNTYVCTECGTETTNTIPATGHSWDSGKVTKKATCTAAGTKTFTCTKCKTTKTETIAKIAHTYKTTTTKATTAKNGSTVTKCSVCGNVSKNTTIYYPKTITLSATSYTYDGKVKQPTVTVKDSKGNKIAASNYTVTYASGRKNVGKYSVKITFKGNYSGSKTLYFSIIPKATTLSSVTAKSKAFTVKWNKQATQTTGYQIQYSTDSKFAKNNKTVTVSKNSTTSTTVSKLSANKKYYVRIRTYKTVSGTKYYSNWSAVKTVTTKK